MSNQFEQFEDLLSDCCFVSVGFRCHARGILLREKLVRETLPFDYGFFTPSSIASILKTRDMGFELNNINEPDNFAFCRKTYNRKFKSFAFDSFSEQWIENRIKDGYNNKFLDSSRGFYTLHKKHKFVLAHYMWHETSEHYTTHYKHNLDNISSMFSRRLKRLDETCTAHQNRIFVHYNHQVFDKITIDDITYDLTDMNTLKNQLNDSYGDNTLLCFSNFSRSNENGIYYYDKNDYTKFGEYVSSRKN